MKINFGEAFKLLNEVVAVRHMSSAERILLRQKKDIINYVAIHLGSIVKSIVVIVMLYAMIFFRNDIYITDFSVYLLFGFLFIIFDSLGIKALIFFFKKFFIGVYIFTVEVLKGIGNYFVSFWGSSKKFKVPSRVFYCIIMGVLSIPIMILYAIMWIIVVGMYLSILGLMSLMSNEVISLFIVYRFSFLFDFGNDLYLYSYFTIASLVVYFIVDYRVRLTNQSLVYKDDTNNGKEYIVGLKLLSTNGDFELYKQDSNTYLRYNSNTKVLTTFEVKSKFIELIKSTEDGIRSFYKNKKTEKTASDNKKKEQSRYGVEILLLLVGVLLLVLNLCNINSLKFSDFVTFDLILTLLPLVLTIISISLSLQGEKIFGIDHNEFRRLRVNKAYTFLEMAIISITIFAVISLAYIFEIILLVYFMEILSVGYAICFLVQELPILLRNENHFWKIVKDSTNFDIGKDKLKEVLRYLILTKSLLETYSNLKTENSEENRELLDELLNIQNTYLFSYKENYNLVSKLNSSEYLGINLVHAIDNSIRNLDSILRPSNELDILDVYGNTDNYYHVTRAFFSLKDIVADKLKLSEKYYYNFSDVIQNMFMIVLYENRENYNEYFYRILNVLLINSVSKGETWFLELLNDYTFSSFIKDDDYLIFVSLYLYYICEMETSISGDNKEKIRNFIFTSNGVNELNSGVSSWQKNFNTTIEHLDKIKIQNLLTSLFDIFDCHDGFSWYQAPFNITYSSSTETQFSKKFIMKWWLGFILSNDNLVYRFEDLQGFDIYKLDDKNKLIISKLLNKLWNQENIEKNNFELPVFDFFKLDFSLNKYVSNTDVYKELMKFKDEHISHTIQSELEEHKKSEEVFDEYRNKLKTAFIESSKEIPIYDGTLDFGDKTYRQIQFLCDTRWSDSVIDRHIENFPQMFSRSIYNSLIDGGLLNDQYENVKEYTKENLENILKFEPDFRNAYLYHVEESAKQLESEVYKIPTFNGVQLPRDVFFKKGAFKVNIEYVDYDSVVRQLKSDELEQIIDRDYSKVDGKYKYVEGVDGDMTQYYTRDEMLRIIGDKYFFVRIIFKYTVEIDEDKILYFKLDR